jgi:hypothetical protein
MLAGKIKKGYMRNRANTAIKPLNTPKPKLRVQFSMPGSPTIQRKAMTSRRRSSGYMQASASAKNLGLGYDDFLKIFSAESSPAEVAAVRADMEMLDNFGYSSIAKTGAVFRNFGKRNVK